jgi:hypothetical protein
VSTSNILYLIFTNWRHHRSLHVDPHAKTIFSHRIVSLTVHHRKISRCLPQHARQTSKRKKTKTLKACPSTSPTWSRSRRAAASWHPWTHIDPPLLRVFCVPPVYLSTPSTILKVITEADNTDKYPDNLRAPVSCVMGQISDQDVSPAIFRGPVFRGYKAPRP